MGRFSCFYGHIHSHKQKKPAQPSFEEMVKTLQLISNNHDVSTESITPTAFQKLPMIEYESKNLSCDTEHVTLSSHGWKSDELKCEYHAEGSTDSMVFGVGNFRKSFSVGCELDRKGRMYDDSNTDDCLGQDFCCDSLHDCKITAKSSSPNDRKSSCTSPPDQDQEAELPVSAHLSSSMMNNQSNFSVDEPHFLEKEEHEETIVPLHMVCADSTGGKTNTPMISKSYSMPNFGSNFLTSSGNFPHTRNRSFENLNMLGSKNEDTSAPDAGAPRITQLNQDDNYCKFEKFDGEDAILDRFNSYNYSCPSKDWIVPVPDEIDMTMRDQTEFSSHHSDHLPTVDFKTKRIEDWVIDLQHCSSVEETVEIAESCNEVKRGTGFIDGLDVARVVTKINPGMEAAKKYISLNATASTAHLANHGLVVVPLLSAFVALKVLNLSGNSIVRVTSGALPRGLHMLNLSKNKISTIEGLKELTRLRVLDLSYNKISRIGHGLASCSSLKELYLAGNKISEVEGLHRLLKLSVLDLRFNKIATSKCLGQLAANYNSLQAISLEGNPAQKNVGDEQLKKYLQSLLPHLAYYNRQHIKSSTLKDSSDRSVRLGISAHQFDRGLRSDHKSSSHRGSPAGSSLKRSSHSSSHGQKGPSTDSTKQLRGRHLCAPSSGTRTSHHHHLYMDNKLQRLRDGLSVHKSRSEGTLAGLQNFPLSQ